MNDILSVAALNMDSDIARIMAYAQQLDEDQHDREVESERDQSKRARMAGRYQESGATEDRMGRLSQQYTPRGSYGQTQSAVRSTASAPTRFLRHRRE